MFHGHLLLLLYLLSFPVLAGGAGYTRKMLAKRSTPSQKP